MSRPGFLPSQPPTHQNSTKLNSSQCYWLRSELLPLVLLPDQLSGGVHWKGAAWKPPAGLNSVSRNPLRPAGQAASAGLRRFLDPTETLETTGGASPFLQGLSGIQESPQTCSPGARQRLIVRCELCRHPVFSKGPLCSGTHTHS